MIRTIRTGAIAATVAIALLAPATVLGAENSRCWGTVTSQFASIYQGMGEHSSSFAGEPRLGLGNVASANDVTLGGLGQFLASVDGLEGTHCP